MAPLLLLNPRRCGGAVLGALFFGLVIISGVTGQGTQPWEIITLDIWTIDDTIIHGTESRPERRLVQEAQFTLSGMMFGWDFAYTPGQIARNLPESFDLTPIATVPIGAPGLAVRQSRRVEEKVYGLIDYHLSAEERQHVSRWLSITGHTSRGNGVGDLMEGWPGKQQAVEVALKHAVREHLRQRYPNRPLDAEGSVRLTHPPRIVAVSGQYQATVRVMVVVREVREFQVW